MSDKDYEAVIELRCVNVAEVHRDNLIQDDGLDPSSRTPYHTIACNLVTEPAIIAPNLKER
jgi:hypothetical protein